MRVKIGPKFFANELRVYRDWITAFWRENIQNSFDAGAHRIDITIGEGSCPETKSVIVSDNGCGMTRETLEEVYFTLGETTKNDANSVGGFGKARILTCFAQKRYVLRTNKLYVEGSGAEYKITDTETFHKGVQLEVEVFHKGRDIESPLKDYLQHCNLTGCQVYINGVRWTDFTHLNRHERSLSFGEVYTNKSRTAGILVRVNGVHMFKPYTSAPFLVIIEVHPHMSRNVLQANRDGLLTDSQDELESFIAELNINKQSALREKKSKSIRYEGTGTFTTMRRPKEENDEVVAFGDGLRAGMEDGDPQFIQTQGRLHSSGYETEETVCRLEVPIFNVMVEDDTHSEKVRRVIDSYYPHNWDLLGEIGWRWNKSRTEKQFFRAGVDKYKLLVVWKAACEKMIDLLQNKLDRGPDRLEWGVGWYFSDTGGACHKQDAGIHWLLLNPCMEDGTMRFGLSSKRDMVKLISWAAHEVTHIVCSDHDERFANTLNDLMEEAMFALSEVLNHMKECKESAIGQLERIANHNKLVAV
jgi:hypothetical protein